MSKMTRRDFINGTLMAVGASMLPPGAISEEVLDALDPLYYPPALTGLRGDNAGSYTNAHNRATAVSTQIKFFCNEGFQACADVYSILAGGRAR